MVLLIYQLFTDPCKQILMTLKRSPPLLPWPVSLPNVLPRWPWAHSDVLETTETVVRSFASEKCYPVGHGGTEGMPWQRWGAVRLQPSLHPRLRSTVPQPSFPSPFSPSSLIFHSLTLLSVRSLSPSRRSPRRGRPEREYPGRRSPRRGTPRRLFPSPRRRCPQTNRPSSLTCGGWKGYDLGKSTLRSKRPPS